jgi:hypothetical protein
MLMPEGTQFESWEDTTQYTRVYHVACLHPAAFDENPGTEDRPFATISRAASLLTPGEKAIVHEGVYRECVCPARGGEGPHRMIAYEAAPGESVTVKGSAVWSPGFRPSEGWRIRGWRQEPGEDIPQVWMADLPAEMLVGYNPFSVPNVSAEIWTFTREWRREEMEQFLLKRGALFVNGRPLKQVFRVMELTRTDGTFWVEDPGLRIHLRLWDDAGPNGTEFEVTVREQVFAPKQHHLGYIRVSGFCFEHAADGVPVPQRAAVSTTRGHHWIIENNRVRWANAVGIDVGAQDWKSDEGDRSGFHIIRRNTVSDCGICGIAGAPSASHTLVEDNLIERIGGLNVERIWECAGLKFHVCTGGLFRRNVLRHIRNACGMWLDVSNRNCRVTGNVFADIESLQGGFYLECSHELNLIDSNVFWDIRQVGDRGGLGVKVDSGDNAVVAHNFFSKIDDYAISMNLNQAERIIDGRVGLCRGHQVLNNVFADCSKRILLARAEDNASDGNLFDVRRDLASFCIQYPAPEAVLNLSAWQRYYGLDGHSSQARITADFDPERLMLRYRVDGELPACQPVAAMHGEEQALPPGPFDPGAWAGSGAERTQGFPPRELRA